MSDERRTSKRLTAYLPGELDTGVWRATVSITRDVSASGLLVFSEILSEIGTAVKIRVAIDGKVLLIEGTVVRAERLPPEADTIWANQLAIAAKGDLALAELYAALSRAPSTDTPK